MNKTQYFKSRRKVCNSSTIDAFKKRHKLYIDNFLKKNEINKFEFMKDIIENKSNKEFE